MTQTAIRVFSIFAAISIVLLIVVVAVADAAKYTDEPVAGGKVVIKDRGNELRKIKIKLPARCESENGQKGTSKLNVNLTGRLAVEDGRFRLSGDAPNGVEVNINSGTVRYRTS